MLFRSRKIRIHFLLISVAILSAGSVCGEHHYFEIKSQLSNSLDEELCLQPKSGFLVAKESKLILKTCSGWKNQKWRVDTRGQFHSKADDSKCLKKNGEESRLQTATMKIRI